MFSVTSVKTPAAALSVLRSNPSIDLVVTDLHMPGMNGIELQKRINKEFKLPVIIMSSDDDENVMLESLAGGAVFFIVKPVDPVGLKNVWQYAVAAKKGKSLLIEDMDRESSSSSPADGKLSLGGNTKSVPSVNNEKNDPKNGSKRKGASGKGRDKDDNDDESKSPPPKKTKKPKIVWTNTLHNQFLEALRQIGLERAVPKKILERMNSTGLTRENVASHLQKYRIFLKRLAERGCFASKAVIDRFLKSNFAAGHPLLLKTAQEYSRLEHMERLRVLASYPGLRESLMGHSSTGSVPLFYGHPGASSSNAAQQPLGYGQSRLLSNQTNRPLFPGSGNISSVNGGGGFSSGLLNGGNSSLTYPNQVQARPDFYNAGPSSSSPFRFGSAGFHSSGSTLGNGLFGSGSSSYPSLNSSSSGSTVVNGLFGSSSRSHPSLNSSSSGATLGNGLFGSSSSSYPSLNNSSYPTLNPGYTNNAANSNRGMRFYEHLLNGSAPPLTVDYGSMNQTRPTGDYGSMNRTHNENINVPTMRTTPLDSLDFMREFPIPPVDSSTLIQGLGTGNTRLTEINSDQLLNNVPNLGNEPRGGDGLLQDLVLESKKLANKEKAGEQSVENSDYCLPSLFPEIYPTLDELLNCDFPDPLSDEDNHPWSEEAIGQVQSELEELINNPNPAAGDGSNESNPITNKANFNF
ncbi:hypothetical protein GOBAR_DD26671 [Gossypium barbadense]|nr:hypothetical protein GOBAR_DD26671 [Gossypium barbadense]